jgi:HEAT repeat protein
LLLLNPVIIVTASTVYSLYAERISSDRMLGYIALLPLPLIVGMHALILHEAKWVYFLLYNVVLAYGSVLYTSWMVYLSGHYDLQEAKRIVPFVTSGQLLGAVLGGGSVALCAPRIGTANVLFLWCGALVGVAGVVWWMAHRFTTLDTESRQSKRSTKPPGLWQNLQQGMTFLRTSSLVLATTVVTILTLLALQLFEYEYSKIFARVYPQPADLAAFLGLFDSLTTLTALLLQWFVIPFCIRRFRVQGTNVLFPYALAVAFGGMLLTPTLMTAMGGRFTRMGLLPSLRATSLNLMLNAVPRKMAARVRSFNTGVAVPVGQGLGAVLLVTLKGLGIPPLFPAIGLLVAAGVVWFAHRQNRAYGEALVGLLRDGQIHLLDLDDRNIRHLDAAAVAAISERLREARSDAPQDVPEMASAHEEMQLTAIALLQAIGSPAACAALQQQIPFARPRVTAAALQAMAATGDGAAVGCLRLYLHDPQAQIRLAALTGLQQLGDPTLHDQAVAALDDPDASVRAAALAVVLATPTSSATTPAQQVWHAMLTSPDTTTRMAALAILPRVPVAPEPAHLYQALGHADLDIRRAALRVLAQLAAERRVTQVDAALLVALQDDDMETRELVLDVLTAIGTPEALAPCLMALDDEQPRVRETLVHNVQRFGRQAMAPLLERLLAPQTSLLAKETALSALARIEGVQARALWPFWEGALRDIYQYKLMVACLDRHKTLAADAFLRLALQNAYEQTVTVLVHLLAVWASPDVARLVEHGLHAADHYQRAHALEALESLGERRFTRLLLPILEAAEDPAATWQEVARHHWHMAFPDLTAVLETCLQSGDRWVLIGALLATHTDTALENGWAERLAHFATAAAELEVRNTAQQLLGHKVDSLYQTLSLPDVMVFLKQVPLYSSLRLDQLYIMAAHLTEYHAQPGTVIVHEGDNDDEFYLILSGQVDIVKQHGASPLHITTLSAGDFFGDMAIFEHRPRVASVISLAESVLLRLSAGRFRSLILQDPAIAFALFRELSARLRRFEVEHGEALV